MAFIKLTEPGASHTLHVTAVTLDQTGNWPDYQFTDGTNTVAVPQKAADRQMERLQVTTAQGLVGAWLTISRSQKAGTNGKHFWNLDLASPPVASKRLPPPEQATRKGDFIAGLDDLDDPTADETPHAPPSARQAAPSATNATPDTARPSPKAEALEEAYLALYSRVAERLCAVGKALEFPVDGTGIQATTATIWISMKDKGLA